MYKTVFVTSFDRNSPNYLRLALAEIHRTVSVTNFHRNLQNRATTGLQRPDL